MTWIFIGVLLGSVVSSQHESKEACLGRKAVLAEKSVTGDCFQQTSPLSYGYTTSSTIRICPSDGGK